MAFKTKVPPPPGNPPAPKPAPEKASPDPAKASSEANVKTTFGTPKDI